MSSGYRRLTLLFPTSRSLPIFQIAPDLHLDTALDPNNTGSDRGLCCRCRSFGSTLSMFKVAKVADCPAPAVTRIGMKKAPPNATDGDAEVRLDAGKSGQLNASAP
jgi:hypothetical protein